MNTVSNSAAKEFPPADRPPVRPVRGRIFDIQRFSVHDGPGIRTTVFFKGCPLRCLWCHNPEGISAQPMLSFLPERCIGCGYCFRKCPQQAHLMEHGRHVLDRTRCRLCGSCTQECFAGALELVGCEIGADAVLAEALRDRPFYETSGGGITLSGGEPLLQPDFALALLEGARAAGINTCIETCGFADWADFERLLPWVDLFLCDLKELDDTRHREFTGVSNVRILENLRRLAATAVPLCLRLPIVPGYNDRESHFAAVAALVRSLPRQVPVEVMPYHRLGEGKADRFGLSGDRRVEAAAPDAATVEAWRESLRREGVQVLGNG